MTAPGAVARLRGALSLAAERIYCLHGRGPDHLYEKGRCPDCDALQVARSALAATESGGGGEGVPASTSMVPCPNTNAMSYEHPGYEIGRSWACDICGGKGYVPAPPPLAGLTPEEKSDES